MTPIDGSFPEDLDEWDPEDQAAFERLLKEYTYIANAVTADLAPVELAIRSSTHILTARQPHPEHPDDPPQMVITLFIDDPFAAIGRVEVARDGELVHSRFLQVPPDVTTFLGELIQGKIIPLKYDITIDLGERPPNQFQSIHSSRDWNLASSPVRFNSEISSMAQSGPLLPSSDGRWPALAQWVP